MLTSADAAAVGKELVRRLIDEVVNGGDLAVLDELYTPAMTRAAARWIEPFCAAFPDVEMEIVQLVGDGDTVAARFRCSGTHLGTWRGHPPTGRRFERIDEVYFFTIAEGRISAAWGLEDTTRRLRQLGLSP
jgi:predicted ester cyclase